MFLGQGFEIRGLCAGHRLVPRDPVVRVFLDIRARRGVGLGVGIVEVFITQLAG